MSSSVAKRRRTAYATAAAAKQRRQKTLVIVGAVIFIAVLAFEVPKTLKLLKGGATSTDVAVHAPVAAVAPRVLPKAFRGRGVSDPFAASSLASSDPTVGPLGGGRDPFVPPSAQSAPVSTPPPAALPQKIVIGTPTKNGSVSSGWIVILASIPTRDGQSSALTFARQARRNGLSSVSVLNSSNRRPLRGGYWVVYTAPLATLAAATRRAADVHALGYAGAYLRQLVVYKR
jgi:hypothetical protein